MADVIFSNNASSLLAASIGTGDLFVQVAAGFGTNYPSPSGNQFFYVTLEDDAGNIEIMRCTNRSTDLLTVVRGQDGTVAQSFTLTVTRVELRTTAAVLQEFVQVSGDAMTGDLDFATNEIQNAYLTGTTRITGGQTIGTAIRGTIDQTNNEIVVPAGSGVRATASGAAIVVDTDNIVALLDSAGVIDFDEATIGLRIGTASADAYLRIYGGAANFANLSSDDTDLVLLNSGLTDFNIDGFDVHILNGDMNLNDNQLIRPEFLDLAITRQDVSGVATTDIDCELGNYVELTLTANITLFTISNPPNQTPDVFGTIRLKVVQGGSAFTIDFSGANVKWPGGAAPIISIGSGDIDFIDLWTDDGGTTWYGSFGQAWS